MTSVLHDEIFEQPDVIQRLLENETGNVAAIAAAVHKNDPRYVVIAARGTSDNAARYAQYVFGAHNKLTVALATPSLYSLYGSAPRLDGALAIGISQSGQSPDIVQVLAEARSQGSPTIAITNDPASPLARAADHVIPLHAGQERSVAATKTYTAQLTALALLSVQLRAAAGEAGQAGTAALEALPAEVRCALTAEAQARDSAQALAGASRCVVLGRGFNYATAFETALKIKELTYLLAEPYSSADFKHGPIALVEPGFPLVIVAAGATLKSELDALRISLRERNAAVTVIGDADNPALPGEHYIPVSAQLPEWLSPIAAITPGQLLAYHLAFARGHNPDQPRTISKVTLTR
jgi:glutamine---fructose-6-phosphate transaminase (isomerizing)